MPQKLNPVASAVRLAFKGLQEWIEVFRVGTHTDMKGRETSFTAEDLDQMVANVTGSGVPFVIGHPKHDDPAYAWAKPGDVKRDGDSLWVLGSDINADFQKLVEDGAYRERSVSITKDAERGWTLLHVGFLGAAAPALAGMKALYGAPADADAVSEFAMGISSDAGWALGDVARLFRGVRDWLIAEKGLDTADQVLPDWTITSLGDTARRITDAAMQDTGPAFNRNPTGDDTMPQPQTFTQADIDRARNEAAAAEALKFAAQGQELSELRTERQAERIGLLINGWTAKGLLLPAEAHGLAEFMAALEGGEAGAFKFAAADKTEVTLTPAAWFSKFMDGRKAVVKLGGAVADPSTDTPPVEGAGTDKEIADRAFAYQKKLEGEGRRISIGAAIDAVNAGKDKA